MEDATIIRGVNEMLTPTWNYLHINDLTLRVPNIDRAVPAPAPAERIHGGMGAGASDWLQRAADVRTSVVINHGVKQAEPIVLAVSGDKGQVADASVLLNDGAEATVVVILSSQEDAQLTCGARLRLDLSDYARVHLFVYTTLHDGYQGLVDVGARLQDSAQLDAHFFLLGAGLTAVGIRTENVGFRSGVTVDARYLARGDEKLDFNSHLALSGRKSTADLTAYGVLADRAEKTLRDTIDLLHGGKGAEGNENETVLLAGKDVLNRSVPIVLCDEDDVVGNHGASIGSISADQLAYLETRGLSPEDAKALLSRSVLDSAVTLAPCAEARDAAQSIARRLLGEDEAAEIAELIQEEV